MPLSAGSSSQAPCGGDLSTPNPIPHTPVRHPSSHDTPFCPDFVRRIRENTQRVREVRGEQQTLWGGFRRKRRSGENVPSPSPSPFSSKPIPSSLLLPAPPEPFAYSPRSGRPNQGRTGYHGKKGVSGEEGWWIGVCGRGLGVDKSWPQGACEAEPADRGIQG